MGMTDQWIMPVYAEILSKYIDENVDPGGKIAWLGQQQANKYSDMYQRIVEKTNQKQIEHHFYDIYPQLRWMLLDGVIHRLCLCLPCTSNLKTFQKFID